MKEVLESIVGRVAAQVLPKHIQLTAPPDETAAPTAAIEFLP
ncbi:hypothetical protein [Streptomyces humi]